MSDLSQISDQANLPDTPNITFSPELEAGPMLSNSPDGEIGQSGPEVAPVSLSQPPGDSEVSQTSGTSGRFGCGSSASIALQQSLESKLRQRLPLDGWTKSRMTWKAKVTPSGRRYYQLAVSRRLMNEDVYSLWPTPQASDGLRARMSVSSMQKVLVDARGGRSYLARVLAHEFSLLQSTGFTAWLMGFPIEWLDCGPSVTR